MENIFERLERYDRELKQSRKDLKKMDKLIALAEQLLSDVQMINKGGVIR
jgi:hypothetical protein